MEAAILAGAGILAAGLLIREFRGAQQCRGCHGECKGFPDGGVVADHKIPPVEEIEPMLCRSGFGEIVIQDKPDRFLVTATKM